MKLKKVKLIFDSQFCGREEMIVNIPENKDEEYVKTLFFKLIGIHYNDDCSYEIIKQ